MVDNKLIKDLIKGISNVRRTIYINTLEYNELIAPDSVDFTAMKSPPLNGHSDKTASIAIKRIEIEERIAQLVSNYAALQSAFNDMFKYLTYDEQTLISFVVLSGYNISEAAAIMGVSLRGSFRIKKSAIAKIADAMDPEEVNKLLTCCVC